MNKNSTILVLNSGSSSLKFAVFGPGEDEERLLLKGSAEGIGRDSGAIHIVAADGSALLTQEHVLESQTDALGKMSDAMRQHLADGPAMVGHRIVHGGPRLREHQVITPEVVAELKAAVHFAPLHIPQSLKLLEAAQGIFPEATQVACFDTVFHCTMPEVAARLPLPREYFDAGVRRYGFHGLSYESIVHRLRGKMPARAVFAHLGNGASVTAVRDGRSVDTSMGLTPTGGVPMGTRTGDLDPGVLLYLMRNAGMDADGLETMLNRQCGLAGMSGGESDMQALLARAGQGDAAAELAVEAFCIAVRKFIAGYVALLGGVDLVVFTGGIGEHSAEVRRRICAGLECFGLRQDDPRVVVMTAEEEAQMARHCRALMRR